MYILFSTLHINSLIYLISHFVFHFTYWVIHFQIYSFICINIYVFTYVLFSLFLSTLIFFPKHIYFCISVYIFTFLYAFPPHYANEGGWLMCHMGVNFSPIGWSTSECVDQLLCLAPTPEDRRLGGKKHLTLLLKTTRHRKVMADCSRCSVSELLRETADWLEE